MDFKETLNGLFLKFGFTNAGVARAASLDASLISRFRTGARLPSRGSDQLSRLCSGIITCADSRGRLAELMQYFGDERISLGDSEAVYSRVYAGLFGEEIDLKPQRNKLTRNPVGKIPHKHNWPVRGVGEKLDKLIKLFDLTNVQVARGVSVDTSLISRVRAGVRVPSSDSKLIPAMAEYFASLPKDRQQLLSLYEIAGVTPGGASSSNDLASHLCDWLIGDRHDAKNDIAGGFINALGKNPVSDFAPMPFVGMPMPSGKRFSAELFSGTAGLRQAVLRFLAESAAQNEPRTIYMYCGHGLGWLLGDEEYGRMWTRMMLSVFYRGNRVKVIHNIEREKEEIFPSTERWLPLFMTGMVEPYQVDGASEGPFTKMLLVSPGVSTLSASFIRGGEAHAEYVYSNDTTMIRDSVSQFEKLLDLSTPLARIYVNDSYSSFFGQLLELDSQATRVRTLSAAPKIWTMPADDLRFALNACDISRDKASAVMNYRAERVRGLVSFCKNDGVIENTTIFSRQDLESGKAYFNLPNTLVPPVPYTVESYRAHLHGIAAAMRHNPKYSVSLIENLPFENIQLAVAEGVCSLVFKGGCPSAVFLFDNVTMVGYFSVYLDSMSERHGRLPKDRGAIIDFLEKY